MAERNEKKKFGKKNGAEIGNGLLPIEHEAGRAGAGRGAGARAAGGRGTQALGRQELGRVGAGARGRASGRVAGRAGARLGERACGWAHGAPGARPAGSTGAQPVRTGWASWVLVHPAWFSAWFFDSVFFLSH